MAQLRRTGRSVDTHGVGRRPRAASDPRTFWAWPRSSSRALAREATLTALPDPRLETVLDLTDGSTGAARSLSVFLISPREAPALRLRARAASGISGVWLDGQRYTFESAPETIHLRFYGWPPEGLALTLDLAAEEPVTMQVIEQSYGLPAVDGGPAARPPDRIADPTRATDVTWVAKRFDL